MTSPCKADKAGAFLVIRKVGKGTRGKVVTLLHPPFQVKITKENTALSNLFSLGIATIGIAKDYTMGTTV